MPLTGTPYVCMSCRYAALQAAPRVTRSVAVKRRTLSYTAAERRNTGEHGSQGSNPSEIHAATSEPSVTGEAQQVGRYSRALLDDLLGQLATSHGKSARKLRKAQTVNSAAKPPGELFEKTSTNVLVEHLSRPKYAELPTSEELHIPETSHGDRAALWSTAGVASTSSAEPRQESMLHDTSLKQIAKVQPDGRSPTPQQPQDVQTRMNLPDNMVWRHANAELFKESRILSQRQDGVVQSVKQFVDRAKKKDYSLAWQILSQLARRWPSSNLNNDAVHNVSLLQAKILRTFQFMLSRTAEYSAGQAPINANEQARLECKDFVLQFLQLLYGVRLLVQSMLLPILCHTLAFLTKENVAEQYKREVFRHLLGSWHYLLSTYTPSASESIQQPAAGAHSERSWPFSTSDTSRVPTDTAQGRALTSILEAEQQLGRSNGSITPFYDYSTAVLLSMYLLKQPRLGASSTADGVEICNAYASLAALWDNMFRGSEVKALSPCLQKLSPEVRADISTTLRTHWDVRMPKDHRKRVQSHETKGHGSSPDEGRSVDGGADDNLKMSSGTYSHRPLTGASRTEVKHQPDVLPKQTKQNFEQQCQSRISRAIERKNPAQADSVLVDILSHKKARQDEEPLSPALWERVVMMFIELQLRARATQVVDIMGRQGMLPSIKLWSVLIKTSSQLNDSKATDAYWHAMLAQGIVPDAHIWSARIFALVDDQRPAAAIAALNEMADAWKANKQAAKSKASVAAPTVEVANAAIAALCRHGDKYASYLPKVLQWQARFDLKPDVDTFNPLISQAMRKGNITQALNLVRKMEQRDIVPDHKTASALMKGLFSSTYLDGYEPAEQVQQVLDILDDIEKNYTKIELDARAYATAIDGINKRYRNIEAVHAVIARMRERKIEITTHVYTMLLDCHLGHARPDVRTLNLLWKEISMTDQGWGAKLDARFYDRALEGLCRHHAQLGIQKIVEILDYLPTMSLRPSWPALHAVAEVFVERGERKRLQDLVHRLRTKSFLMANDGSQIYGYKLFWDFIVKIGILRDEDITSWKEVRSQRRGASFTPASKAIAEERSKQ